MLSKTTHTADMTAARRAPGTQAGAATPVGARGWAGRKNGGMPLVRPPQGVASANGRRPGRGAGARALEPRLRGGP